MINTTNVDHIEIDACSHEPWELFSVMHALDLARELGIPARVAADAINGDCGNDNGAMS